MTYRVIYGERELLQFYLLDLAVDLRAARRDGDSEYAASLEEQIGRLFKGRHRARIDRNGIPFVPAEGGV